MIDAYNTRTDIAIPIDILKDIAYFLKYKRQVNVKNYLDRSLVLTNRRGLDALSAFYLGYYLGEEVPTRHPNIVALLFGGAHFVDTLIDAAVDDVDSGMLDQRQVISMWSSKKDTPEWMLHQINERLTERFLSVG